MVSQQDRNLFNDEYIRQIRLWAKTNNLTGKNVKIAVLDTGIIRETKFLHDAIVQIPSTTQWRLNATTESIDLVGTHGTEVACLIHLVAPDAKIFDVKTACVATRTQEDFLEAALEDCVERIKPDIVNISLGMHRPEGCDGYCRLCKMVDFAADHGIIVVASAGNRGRSGPTACPSNARGAISVGGATYGVKGSETQIVVSEVSSWSWREGKPDLIAPSDIPVKVRFYLLVPTWVEIEVDETHLGTSYASPFASGLIALILELRQQVADPVKFASDTKATVLAGALHLDGFPKVAQGNGLIDITKANVPRG
jgi:subtilisin family serine protease